MESFEQREGGMDQGTITLVLHSAKAAGRVSLAVVWAWATHFNLPRENLRVPRGYFEHQQRVSFEEVRGGAAPSRFFPRIVLLGASGRSGEGCLEGRSKELPDIAEEVLRAMRMEVEETGLTLPVAEGGKEGKRKVIGREVSKIQRKRRSRLCKQIGFQNDNEAAESNGEAARTEAEGEMEEL